MWLDIKDAHNQNSKITGYPTEKPLELLYRIIEASSNPGDLVLDCFAGSGTTLHAAADKGRSWIGVDSSFEAIRTVLDRCLYGLKPMGDFVSQPQPPLYQESFMIDDSGLRKLDFELFCDREDAARLRTYIERWRLAVGSV